MTAETANRMHASEPIADAAAEARSPADSGERKAAQEEYWRLFENASAGIYRSTAEGRPLRVNRALARMNGYASEAELCAALTDIGREWYVDPSRRDTFVRLMLEHGRVEDFVSRVYRHRTGEAIWVSENAWLVGDEAGCEQPVFEGTIIETTDRILAAAGAEAAARLDALTGLPNRLALCERLQTALARRAREGSVLAVLVLGVDRFKGVNDTLGYAAGDALLAALARRLAGLLGRGEMLARFGSDEFVVIMPDLRRAEDAVALARRIVAAAQSPVDVDGRTVSVGVSLGIAFSPDHEADAPGLLRAADIALQRAKLEGRGGWQVYSRELAAIIRFRRELELDLRAALGRGEFCLHYQPVARLSDRSIVAYEALLRWNRPGRGPVEPDVFIPIAEETRLILPIGEWVLAQACRDAARWRAGADVAVNVSAVQLGDPGFAERLGGVLDTVGLAPSRLILEVTETALIDPRLDLDNRLAPLRRRGVRVALDDFGTGYSAWSHLRARAFDGLKIDASFVARLHEPESAAIVATLFDLARRLSLEVVAEGVENDAQLDQLAALGCTIIQGHLIGRGVPAAEIARS